MTDFSSRLRELRLNNGLRQEQVAKLVGVDKSSISYYENSTRQPSFDVLLRLASLYRVSTDYLLGQSDIYSVNLAGLSKEEAVHISGLVEIMSKKNEVLNRR